MPYAKTVFYEQAPPKVPVAFRVLESTRDKIDAIADATGLGKGEVLDTLVAQVPPPEDWKPAKK